MREILTTQDPKKDPARLNALESRIKGPGQRPQLWQPTYLDKL
jgi:hypothetical protein